MKPACLAVCLLLAAVCHAETNVYVNPQIGDDANVGSREKPYATVSHAIAQAPPGTTIHLLPKGAVYRQMAEFIDKEDITLEGNDVTLTGADVLPADGWETVEGDLHRRKVDRNFQDRALLIVDGRLERMGRRPGSPIEKMPAPDAIAVGQFTMTAIDEKTAWLYVRGPVDQLEWSVRMAGVASGRTNRNITIRNLNTRHTLNDGFNIHGDCRGLRCFNVTGYGNYDEGFSAHDTSEVYVESSRFYGNDSAVADVNGCDSVYVDCEFRNDDALAVLFSGGKHRLERCLIAAGGQTAISISHGRRRVDGENVTMPVDVEILTCTIQSMDSSPRPIAIKRAHRVVMTDCVLRGITFDIEHSSVTATGCELDGKPLVLE